MLLETLAQRLGAEPGAAEALEVLQRAAESAPAADDRVYGFDRKFLFKALVGVRESGCSGSNLHQRSPLDDRPTSREAVRPPEPQK